MRFAWIIALVIGVAAAAAIVVVEVRAHHVRPASAVPVQLPQPTEIVLTGRVEPRVTVAAVAPVAGAINAFFLDVNQQVYKDQLLGRIRDTQGENTVEQAQAEVDSAQVRTVALNADQLAAKLEVSRAEADRSRARADLDRLEKNYQKQKGLWDLGATPRLTFEKAEADYKNAQTEAERLEGGVKDAEARATKVATDIDAANRAAAEAAAALDRAKAALSRGEIHSPVDGMVASRHGQPGETVEQNTTLFEIATDLTHFQVRIAATPQMRVGQPVIVRVPELNIDEIAGTVRELHGEEAVIDFTSPVAASRLDLTAQVKIKY